MNLRHAAPRIEAIEKVTGRAAYPAEVEVEGLAHAALVVASIPSGRVVGIDASRALATSGVLDVITHETATPVTAGGYLAPLQDAMVRFAGQIVAVVVAESAALARAAAMTVAVSYEAAPAVTAIDQPGAEIVTPKEAAGGVDVDSRRGDPGTALAASEVVLRRRYTTPAHNHHPMEPPSVIAVWRDDKVTVHTTSQAVFAMRRVIAHAFGLPRENVRVITRHLGGGFGAKGRAWLPCMVLGVAVARQVGRPVRLELTREQMFTLLGRRQETVQDLAVGMDRDGRLNAIVHDTLAQTAAFADHLDPTATVSRMLYACPNVATTQRLARTHAPLPNPMRAPGEGPGSFALESALDELAWELGIDPVDLRLRNFADHDQHLAAPWSSNSLRECYRVGAEAFGWAGRPQAIGALGEGRHRLGWGMAAACYPVFRLASQASVSIAGDGRVQVRCGTQDMGTGTYTVLGQLAAELLGVPLSQVGVELGDTELPEGPYSGGSMATASFTPAVEDAARDLRRKLLGLASSDPASPLHGLPADRLALDDGHVRSLDGNRSEALASLVARAAPQGLESFASVRPDLDRPYSAYGFGAVFVEARVDTLLGEVRLTRVTAAYAAGRILNPLLAHSQYVGGLIGGIGMALHEEVVEDRRLGRIVGDNFVDYLIPVHADMPRFDVRMVEEADPHLAGGVKGIGMLGTVGTAAAIANAVFHATGRRIRELPIRLEDLIG